MPFTVNNLNINIFFILQ